MVLFVLAFLLVFFGTWAQVDASIWTVVNKYFRWLFVWMPLKVLVFRAIDIPENYGIPFPGGWTLGDLLLDQFAGRPRHPFQALLEALRHSHPALGLIVMMLGEFFTGVFAIEGRMTIVEGYASNFVESDRHYELAIVDRAGPKDDDEVPSCPASFLREGSVIKDVEPFPSISKWSATWRIPTFAAAKDKDNNPATAGVGLHRIAAAQGRDIRRRSQPGVEFPSAYVTLKREKDRRGRWAHISSPPGSRSCNAQPDTVNVDGKKYADLACGPSGAIAITRSSSTSSSTRNSSAPKSPRIFAARFISSKPGKARKSPGGNLHEPSAVLSRRNVLPVAVPIN